MDRYTIKLKSGRTLHSLGNEDVLYGLFEVLPDGKVRIWREVWFEEYAPSKDVFPGPISAMRALREGAV